MERNPRNMQSRLRGSGSDSLKPKAKGARENSDIIKKQQSVSKVLAYKFYRRILIRPLSIQNT